ncbi:lytic transglycosylase domain-containing protein [Pleurocapsa sp. FMAR1]|uniref:lytic transglycosylase domain-containing protein n=1 Tax=Pleurocapsa sp. FMAR1 TaxID=3040204 RepID=UPI0029C9A188|nr:transglycosylase SLT domain-containing protein [Pleurocapsa sp. FMAR1]
MLKSHLRSKKPKRKPAKHRAHFFLKHKRLILLVLISSLGWGFWQVQSSLFSQSRKEQVGSVSPIVNLRSLAPTARANQLKLLSNAEGNGDSAQQIIINRNRARYLLATDLIQQQQGKLALTYLQGLAEDYPLLRPQILFKTAQAYQQNKEEQAAQRTLEDLIENYPRSPITANAISLLDGDRSQHQARLIREFPYHPLAQKLARQGLQQNPDQFKLLLLLAKYSRDADLNKIRERLVLEYSGKLTPEDWEAIANGYWREDEYRRAADAYAFAPDTPRNLYRVARGFHRNGNLDAARLGYQILISEYHDAREAGQALLYLASISSGDEAVVYLEKAIAKFPDVAPEAYRSKAIIHERFGKYKAAAQARDRLLNKYGDSSAAVEYRCKIAQELANKGNKKDAWQWMQPVVKSNLELDFAPQALYQTGIWATDLGKPAAAETVFKKIIGLYPQSYWAWRSAIKLNWQVGDFEQVRSLNPALDLAKTYSPLPTGSKAMQELYLLGQYHDAWLLLQSEIEQHQQLTVNEQFSEGILKLELGQYSAGMQEIWDLTKRDDPQELEQWKALRKTTAYWQGLFPFPYESKIREYAQQEQINPLLVISVMRKESTFDPKIDSAVGAIGLMQIVPPTANWIAKQIQLPNYSLTNPDDNIKIGTWYLKHNHDRYQDNSLLAVASYNAGTSNVNDWLTKYDLNDRDRFIEQIPFPETKDYVEGVFGNYWNYLRLYNPEIRQKVDSLGKN